LTIPKVLPTAGGLTMTEWRRAYKRSDPAAGGTCTVILDPVPDGETWRVERLVVTCTSTSVPLVRVYAGAVADFNVVDATAAGNLDIADEDPPLLLTQGEQLICVWTGATDGAVGTFRAQWAVYTKAATP
jgi:hypothetical protein